LTPTHRTRYPLHDEIENHSQYSWSARRRALPAIALKDPASIL
jgi:hypothetical protein